MNNLRSMRRWMMQERFLCAAEQDLAAHVFGAAINLEGVRVLAREHWASGAARLLGRGRHAVVRGDRIFMPQRNGSAPPADFCALGGAWPAFLAHELTHVWQYQAGRLTLAAYVLSFDWRYDYSLKSGRDFLDYGFEQQASIVEDYVRLSHGLPARHASHGVSAPILRGMLPFGGTDRF